MLTIASQLPFPHPCLSSVSVCVIDIYVKNGICQASVSFKLFFSGLIPEPLFKTVFCQILTQPAMEIETEFAPLRYTEIYLIENGTFQFTCQEHVSEKLETWQHKDKSEMFKELVEYLTRQSLNIENDTLSFTLKIKTVTVFKTAVISIAFIVSSS